MTTAAERGGASLQELRALVLGVVRISLGVEAGIAVMLLLRFWLHYDQPLPRAAWLGIFHAISAFNNAGFGLFSDSLVGFVGDPWICLPISAGIIIGGLGFPVLIQLARHLRTSRLWSLNTRLVLVGTPMLLGLGTVFICLLEWRNPATLGPLPWQQKLLAGFFQSVQTRTAGFNSIDIASMDPTTWLGMDVLMFIGGGPAGTAGGIKITTFLVLLAIIVTELRGDAAVNVLGKRLSRSVHRQAMTVALLAVALVMAATLVIMWLTPFTLDQVVFEVVSAFATVGISTGITSQLPAAAQLLLVCLMFTGRLGPVALATALALQPRTTEFELPKERPIIG